MRHLPRHYPGNSVYSLYPFFTPSVTRQNLTRLGIFDQYTDYDGKRPTPQPVPRIVDTVAGIQYVLKNPKKYSNPYTKDMATITGGYESLLSFDEEAQ